MERLLDALAGMGFLVKNQNTYVNSNISLEYLVKQSADYIGGIAHWNTLWDRWSRYDRSY